MAESRSFERLSRGVQRWVYQKGWSNLRAVQEQAIVVILPAREDVLITAPTAGGKTEAAFLPAVSWLENEGPEYGYGVLCLSPLKALINDQFSRLELLCDSAGTQITPWHGDVPAVKKSTSWRSPKGILLITPESLEAMFVNRAAELKARVASLRYVIIDEFHAFIDRERGQQLLSQLSRLEDLIGRPVIRIGLSATIGDPAMALQFLRPDGSVSGVHLDAEHEKTALQLGISGYVPNLSGSPTVYEILARDLFKWLRGRNNLVFANSRNVVEVVTDALTDISEREAVPLEFFAHHGSLSREVRYHVEQRLKDATKPTTAIATSTLELGIDIGDVDTVVQIDAPSNVSSVRQRLGRSGRREGSVAKLRLPIIASSYGKDADPLDSMEINLFQAMAVTSLMLERWIEPPSGKSLHLSTLVQQILSMIANQGSITAAGAYKVLCRHGPWGNVSPDFFARVLRGLGSAKVIQQLGSGELVVGELGERIVSSHTFYTAFEVPDEFRLVAGGKAIGTIPVDNPIVIGQLLLFGGRRWKVVDVDLQARTISLVPGSSGKAPIFGGEAAPVHGMVKRRMLELYQSSDIPPYCDSSTHAMIERGRSYFSANGIGSHPFVKRGRFLYWFLWESDRVVMTLVVILVLSGFEAFRYGCCLVVDHKGEPDELVDLLKDALQQDSLLDTLKATVVPVPLGKYDSLIGSPDVLSEAFISEKMDLSGAAELLANQ